MTLIRALHEVGPEIGFSHEAIAQASRAPLIKESYGLDINVKALAVFGWQFRSRYPEGSVSSFLDYCRFTILSSEPGDALSF